MTAKSENDEHLIARNDELDKRMAIHPDIDTNIRKLFDIGRRNRRLIKLLYASVILEIVLFAAVVYFGGQVLISKNQTSSNHAALVSSCNSGNEFRKDNLALWAYILGIKPVQPPTEEQKKTAVDFTSFIKKTFALRDCNKIK